ncbi:MAG: alpha-galactosidase [Lentisphaeria bacterium]|nr:alpha-galactosidase [Lentisphaeria bacterium]
MKKELKAGNLDVILSCANPGNWQFACTKGGSDGVHYIFITLENGKEEYFPEFTATVRFPQHDVAARWQADGFFNKNLPPEWNSRFESELGVGAPLIGFCGENGNNRLICSSSDALRKTVWAGGPHEHDFYIETRLVFFTAPESPASSYSVVLRLDTRDINFSDALAENFKWFEDFYHPIPVPEAGLEAWYSTWYSYHKELTSDEIEAECRLAKSLGMGGVLVDDGWQTDKHDGIYDYTGDWEVAPSRIADMKKHVDTVHSYGLKYMLWYSVPFVGEKSRNFERFKGKYLFFNERLHAAILDPRFPEVREFLIGIYRDALINYGLDGFKLDFIDRMSIAPGMVDPAEAEDYAGRDIKNVSEAVDVLFNDIIRELRSIKSDILIEFRQRYMGPAIRQYGNLIRATDCPGDIVANRVRTIDLRHSSCGSAVHGDMLRWHEGDSVESAARQFLAVLFSVPQISARLADIPESHREMIRHRVEFYRRYRDTLVFGRISAPHFDQNYPVVKSTGKCDAVTAVYNENVFADITFADVNTEVLVNATASSSVIVNVAADCKAVFYDVCGKVTQEQDVSAGLQKLEIPISGECVFTKIINC